MDPALEDDEDEPTVMEYDRRVGRMMELPEIGREV